MHRRVRRLALSHLHSQNANRPQVGLAVMPDLLDYFGGHPEWRSDDRFALLSRLGQLPGHAEVRQLHSTRRTEQHVPRLDVAVDVALLVDIPLTTRCLCNNPSLRGPSQARVLCERATCMVF